MARWQVRDPKAVYKPHTTISNALRLFFLRHHLPPLRLQLVLLTQVHHGSEQDHRAYTHDDERDRRRCIFGSGRDRSKEPGGQYSARFGHDRPQGHGGGTSDVRRAVRYPRVQCWPCTTCPTNGEEEGPVADVFGRTWCVEASPGNAGLCGEIT